MWPFKKKRPAIIDYNSLMGAAKENYDDFIFDLDRLREKILELKNEGFGCVNYEHQNIKSKK